MLSFNLDHTSKYFELLASKYSTSDLISSRQIRHQHMQFDTRHHSKDTNAWSESACVCVYTYYTLHTHNT